MKYSSASFLFVGLVTAACHASAEAPIMFPPMGRIDAANYDWADAVPGKTLANGYAVGTEFFFYRGIKPQFLPNGQLASKGGGKLVARYKPGVFKWSIGERGGTAWVTGQSRQSDEKRRALLASGQATVKRVGGVRYERVGNVLHVRYSNGTKGFIIYGENVAYARFKGTYDDENETS